jgi:hypothetical protein
MDDLPEKLTIGEAYGPAMQITDQAEANAYFQRLVDRHMTYFRKTRSQAEEIERQNLGYYAGYYDNETRRRVEALFGCAHPIFGALSAVGAPTPEEALQEGRSMASR